MRHLFYANFRFFLCQTKRPRELEVEARARDKERQNLPWLLSMKLGLFFLLISLGAFLSSSLSSLFSQLDRFVLLPLVLCQLKNKQTNKLYPSRAPLQAQLVFARRKCAQCEQNGKGKRCKQCWARVEHFRPFASSLQAQVLGQLRSESCSGQSDCLIGERGVAHAQCRLRALKAWQDSLSRRASQPASLLASERASLAAQAHFSIGWP